jgi:hypothetical protein
MKNDKEKIIIIGISGTRLNFTSLNGIMNMCRDLYNDGKLLISDGATNKRQTTTSNFIT